MAIHIPSSVRKDEELLRAATELAPHLSGDQTEEFSALLATYDVAASNQDKSLLSAFQRIRDAYGQRIVELRRTALIRTIASRKSVSINQPSP